MIAILEQHVTLSWDPLSLSWEDLWREPYLYLPPDLLKAIRNNWLTAPYPFPKAGS